MPIQHNRFEHECNARAGVVVKSLRRPEKVYVLGRIAGKKRPRGRVFCFVDAERMKTQWYQERVRPMAWFQNGGEVQAPPWYSSSEPD